jgi:dehydrogenase/reductase SDR family protein 7B
MTLANKTIWITGASSGIGEALAIELSSRDVRLVLSARRAEELERVRSRCANQDRVFVLPMDVADTGAAENNAARAAALASAPIDVMVHNAGIGQRALAKDTPLSEDRRIMELNYFGVIALTKALLPGMRERRRGHFVVISSVTGYVGTPHRSAYAASKHALHGFFEALRAEVFAEGILVTMICPGFVRTEIAKKALTAAGTPNAEGHTATEAGLAPEVAARKIAKAMERETRETYVGGGEIAGIYLRRYVPGVLARALRRVKTT